MSEALLQIRDLHTHFGTKAGVVKAVDGVSLDLEEDSVLGLVGESGSGKSVTALSILGIVPFPGNIVGGSIIYRSTDLVTLGEEEMRRIRGKSISMIFQDVGAALNPVMSIGAQVEEIMLEHTDMSESEARSLAVDLLSQTGIADTRRILDQYPFQLSGGMGQRVMMAIGVALKPRVLIADEPTSSLDVTMQAEMLLRLKQLQAESGTAIMLITHDLGVIAQVADTVAVMYGGTIVEYTDIQTLFARPRHPYTWELFQALPWLDSPPGSLIPMRGTPPTMLDPPDHCPFLERCPKAINECRTGPKPKLEEMEPGHRVACYNPVAVSWN